MKMKSNKPRRVLSIFTLVMINVIAVDSLRTLPISAEYGTAAIFYYTLAAILFFVPTALVAAELATGWPKTGGIYVWVREAFGNKVGFLVTWLVWVYNVVWFPTIMVFLAGTIAYLINPALAHSKLYLLSTILILFWGATIINCFGMRISGLVSIIGALIGTLLPMFFIIILGVFWFTAGNKIQIHLTPYSIVPSIHSLKNLALLVGVIFGLVGMEMSAVHAEEVKNPQRDYPKALLYSTLIIYISMVLGSLAIAVVVPQKHLSLVTGLIDAFRIFFIHFNMQWMLPVIIFCILIGGFSGVSAWIIGCSKGLLVASRDGSFPAIFGRVNKHGVPVPILILQGVIFTLLCSIFLLMPTLNSSYWLLTAMTAQLAMLVYIGMFAAVIKLRYSQPDKPRAFKIPGGNIMIWLIAGLALLTCLCAIAVGFLPPSQFKTGNVFRYEAILVSGIAFFCILPLIIARFTKTTKPDEPAIGNL